MQYTLSVPVALFIRHAKRLLLFYCYLRLDWIYRIFTHYIISGRILGKQFLCKKCFYFLYKILQKNLILIRIQRDVFKNVPKSSCKVPVILVRSQRNFDFLHRFSKNAQISNFMIICPVGCSMRTDGQTRRSL